MSPASYRAAPPRVGDTYLTPAFRGGAKQVPVPLPTSPSGLRGGGCRRRRGRGLRRLVCLRRGVKRGEGVAVVGEVAGLLGRLQFDKGSLDVGNGLVQRRVAAVAGRRRIRRRCAWWRGVAGARLAGLRWRCGRRAGAGAEYLVQRLLERRREADLRTVRHEDTGQLRVAGDLIALSDVDGFDIQEPAGHGQGDQVAVGDSDIRVVEEGAVLGDP